MDTSIGELFTARRGNKIYKVVYHHEIGFILEKPRLSYEIVVAEVAQILKIHPESVRRLVRGGALRARRVGMKFIFDYSYVRKFATYYDNRAGNKSIGIRHAFTINDTIDRYAIMRTR
jgi:excisionase family DNA binding protein